MFVKLLVKPQLINLFDTVLYTKKIKFDIYIYIDDNMFQQQNGLVDPMEVPPQLAGPG